MKTSKFFRFTIAGDKLNVAELKEKIPLDSSVYYKDIPIEKELGVKRIFIAQNTNRWVYSDEAIDCSKPETFLTKNLLVLKKHLPILRTIIPYYECRIDLIIYSGDKTDICLNSKQMKILNDLDVNFYISFC